jgi:hypothetical protein
VSWLRGEPVEKKPKRRAASPAVADVAEPETSEEAVPVEAGEASAE